MVEEGIVVIESGVPRNYPAYVKERKYYDSVKKNQTREKKQLKSKLSKSSYPHEQMMNEFEVK